MVWWYGGMVGWVLLPGSLTGGYKIATNLPKQFANLQQMHVNTDMTDTRHKKHTGLEGGGCAWPGWMGWLGVAFKSESAGVGVRQDLSPVANAVDKRLATAA